MLALYLETYSQKQICTKEEEEEEKLKWQRIEKTGRS